MASGLPVIAADTPVNREILGNEGPTACALFFPVGDAKALRRLIEMLIHAPIVRAEMGRYGLKRSAQFSWERCAQEVMAILREVAR